MQGFLTDVDRYEEWSCVRPVGAVYITAGLDEVRVPGPYRLTSFKVLTAPRGVPVAVPFNHHSHLPLHIVTAACCRRCSYYLRRLVRRDRFRRVS